MSRPARVYLVRHARPAATWGAADADPGLDELGRSQALAACDRLLALPQGVRPTGVISSPLKRCLATAEPMAAALGVAIQLDPAVGEIPTPAGLPYDARPQWLRRAFAGEWRQIEGDIDYLAWRAAVAHALLSAAGCAVFSHFVAINAVVTLLTQEARVLAFRPDHASITVLETDGGQLRLMAKGAEASTSVL